MLTPVKRICKVESGSYTLGTSALLTCTTGATNVKGSQSSTLFTPSVDLCGLSIGIFVATAANYLVDIYVNGVKVIPDLLCGSMSSNTNYRFFFPLSIPAGSVITAAAQSSGTVGRTVQIYLQGWSKGLGLPDGLAIVEAYGTNSSGATDGTVVDSHDTTPSTKGSWASMGTTTRDIRYLTLGFAMNSTRDGTEKWLLDIATNNVVTAEGSSDIIVPNTYLMTTGSSFSLGPMPLWSVSIPSGTTLYARCQCNSTTITKRSLDIALYGAS